MGFVSSVGGSCDFGKGPRGFRSHWLNGFSMKTRRRQRGSLLIVVQPVFVPKQQERDLSSISKDWDRTILSEGPRVVFVKSSGEEGLSINQFKVYRDILLHKTLWFICSFSETDFRPDILKCVVLPQIKYVYWTWKKAQILYMQL